MSDILIKGMEMPITCRDCRMSTFTDFDSMPFCNITMDDICVNDWETKRCDNCPLVEIPPHGRLKKRVVYRIDVFDALESARINALDGILTDRYKNGFHDGLKRALEILANEVQDAPTIVEAEEGE